MPLFIHCLPLHTWTDRTRTPPLTYWSIPLPVFVTDPGLNAPPAGAPLQDWLLDTGNTGEAFAWRHHLLQAGLDPDVRRLPGHIRIASALHPTVAASERLSGRLTCGWRATSRNSRAALIEYAWSAACRFSMCLRFPTRISSAPSLVFGRFAARDFEWNSISPPTSYPSGRPESGGLAQFRLHR